MKRVCWDPERILTSLGHERCPKKTKNIDCEGTKFLLLFFVYFCLLHPFVFALENIKNCFCDALSGSLGFVVPPEKRALRFHWPALLADPLVPDPVIYLWDVPGLQRAARGQQLPIAGQTKQLISSSPVGFDFVESLSN